MDRFLQNTNVVKIVALFLAIALWFVVNGESSPASPQYKRSVETYRISEVSLSAKFDQDRLAIVKMPKTVTVELQGSPSTLNRNITPSDYEVFVDVRGYGKGTHRVPVLYEGFPGNLSVRVIPETVEVVLEEKQRVEKEVNVHLLGAIPEGYSTGEAIVKPKKVHITVPESQVKRIGQVQAAVNVEGAKNVIEQTVPLRVLDKEGNPMEAEINPSVVEVEVPVTSPYKLLPVKLTYLNNPPAGFSIANIRLLTDKITVYGPVEVIDKMTFYPGPQIDLSTLNEDRYMQLRVPLLPNIIKTEPDFVEVEINVAEEVERTFQNIPITVNGLADQLKTVFVSPENGMVTLTLRGAPNQMKELKMDDIQLYIDVSNLPPGRHELPIEVNLPTFISVKGDAQAMRAMVQIEKNP